MAVDDQVNARSVRMTRKDMLKLVGEVDRIFAAKGKKVVYLDLRADKPAPATLEKLLLGPTGNLRAPTLRKGRTLVVGFDQETYNKLFG